MCFFKKVNVSDKIKNEDYSLLQPQALTLLTQGG